MTKIYYKITNAEENHNGFQYVDGLNILKEEFDNNPDHHCCAGGLYFTDTEHIFGFLNYGIYLREITLPTENPNFKIVADENKYRANMLILGKRYELLNVETIKMLMEAGADVHTGDDYALKWSAYNGYLEVVKYLIGAGADVHAENDLALRWSAEKGHLEVVKYLIEKGADLHARDDYALKWSACYDRLKVVKYLIEKGANIDVIEDDPIMEKLKINR